MCIGSRGCRLGSGRGQSRLLSDPCPTVSLRYIPIYVCESIVVVGHYVSWSTIHRWPHSSIRFKVNCHLARNALRLSAICIGYIITQNVTGEYMCVRSNIVDLGVPFWCSGQVYLTRKSKTGMYVLHYTHIYIYI